MFNGNGVKASSVKKPKLYSSDVSATTSGRHDYGRFIERVFTLRGTEWRMLHASASGQPALAAYCRGRDGYQLHTLQVLTVTPAGISHNTVFQDPEVFAAFRLDRLVPDPGRHAPAPATVQQVKVLAVNRRPANRHREGRPLP